MFYLNRIKPEFASDSAGILPNDRFWKQDESALGTTPASDRG